MVYTFTLVYRYQFFLQLKHDLLYGRLECPSETVVELSAFALQCKYTGITTNEPLQDNSNYIGFVPSEHSDQPS